MSKVGLYLLGSPRLELDGQPVSMDTRKALALFAYLAIAGEEIRRETLAALLWPEYDHSHALGALRRTLSSLRSALCEGCLDISRETIGIAPEANLYSDIAHFRQLIAEAHAQAAKSPSQVCQDCLYKLVEAAGLYRDHFMAGFSLRDSPQFDDWQFFQAEALRQELSGVLETIVKGYSALGEFETAIPYAQRWLSLDNLHEPAHRLLMQLFAWSGRRSAAIHQYQECVRILEDELGVPPLEETTQLYQAILENRLPSPVIGEASRREFPDLNQKETPVIGTQFPVQSGEVHFPLVGRSQEWQALWQAYRSVGPDGHFIVLEGEAGIGKTRLAEEFLGQLRRSGGRIFSGRCYEGESHLAFAPFLEGLRGVIKQGDNRAWWKGLPDMAMIEGSRLLPELSGLRPGLGAPMPLEGPGAQNRFFEGLLEIIFATVVGEVPGVIFIDDIQWMDEASLNLLTYLVRRLQGRSVLLLVTWRGEDLPAEHRLRRLLAESQRSGRATYLSLSRLTEETTAELLQAFAPDNPTIQEFHQRLYRETEGLPFFIVEYLHLITGNEAEGLAQEWSMPGGVRDLLLSRLAPLSETASQLLQAAAVIGRSFDYDTLRLASGRTEEESVDALEELIGRGLIREFQVTSDNSGELLHRPFYDFSHDKLRQLVYEEISLARRRLLHRRVAETIQSRSRQELPAVSGQIAYHYRQAGNTMMAAKYYLQAGEYARSLYANAEALVHFRNALMLGHDARAWLNEAIGDLQVLQGEYNAARSSYETTLALFSPNEGDLTRVEQKLGELFSREGNWDRAEAHYRSALEASNVEKKAGVQAGIYSNWSRTVLHRGENERALEYAHRALSLAEEAGDQGVLSQAHNILGIIARNSGKLEEASMHLEASLKYAQEAGQPEARVAALNNLALVYAARNDLSKAVEVAQRALEVCKLQGDRHREAALHNNLADLYHMLGESDLAMDHLRKAVVIFSEIGEEGGRANPEIWKLMEW